MKIKRLIEEKKLIEANDEIDLAEIDPQADSTQDIAAAVQDEIEELSDGEVEISSEEAREVAKITKDVALAVNAGQVTFAIEDADFEDAKIENRLTRALDKAYETAKTSMSDNSKNGANILVEGLPGSGKTAIVES
jgi:DNA replication protein DnaC